MKQLAAVGVLGALAMGCGYRSHEYSVGESVRLLVERGSDGRVSLVELVIGPENEPCVRTKIDLAVKSGAPTALLTRHHAACHA